MTKNRDQGSGVRDQFSVHPRAVWDDRAFCGLVRTLFVVLALPLGLLLVQSRLVAQAVPDVYAIAQLVDRHYNTLHSLRANFTESYSGLGMNKTESGTLLLLKPGRMRWDYNSPAGKLFLIDGKYAWFYTQGSPQVQRTGAKQLDDLRSPIRFLLGHTQVEKELGSLQLAGNSPGALVLIGQPKGQENRIQRVTLTITAGTGSIQSIEIEEIDGAITRFTFSNEQTNVAIPDSTFHFEPPAGVTVVDAVPPA